MKRILPLPVERGRQEAPEDLVADVMGVIRGQFYGDLPGRAWFQQQHFIRERFVLWPARWLDQRGVTLKPERYRAILLEILTTIKQHGNTAGVKYWPRYLVHCVQQHFAIHCEEYYSEGKSLRSALDRVMATAARAQTSTPDPVRVMAEAGRLLAAGKRRKKVVPRPKERLLFDL